MVDYPDIPHDASTEERTESTIRLAREMFARNPGFNRIRMLIVATVHCFDVDKDGLLLDKRVPYLVRPRHIMFAIAREITNYSLPEIGRQIGDRDHSTILHGARKYAAFVNDIIKRMKDDSENAEQIEARADEVSEISEPDQAMSVFDMLRSGGSCSP
jgi:chromosomal replication initiation ATPase DnaA